MSRNQLFFLIWIFAFKVQFLFCQYHNDPAQDEYNFVLKIANKEYAKTDLPKYHKYVVIYFGDLACNDPLNGPIVNKALFQSGIKFQYYKRKKCIFKKKKYIVADIYFVDNSGSLLGYFNGKSLVSARTTSGEKMYEEIENFIKYLMNNQYKSIYNLGCVDGSLYYAIDNEGSPVLLDIGDFYGAKNEIRKIKISSLE